MSRESKGQRIAERGGVSEIIIGMYKVASASGGQTHVVQIGDPFTCSCPDWQKREEDCKHVWAVRLSLNTPVPRSKGKSYPRSWKTYNAAQTHEKEHVIELLRELCKGIVQPEQKSGRKRVLLADLVFAAAMKVYLGTSGRRAQTDLRELGAKGYMSKVPHYNSISRYMEQPGLAALLKQVIEESAGPLKAVESDFAVDSSGFSMSSYRRWYDEKWGRMRSSSEWVKVHLMCGVKTNIVTSVEVTAHEGPGSGDAPHLLPLTKSTASRFKIAEVSADMAYLSRANIEGIAKLGATPFIPLKINSTIKGGSEAWNRLFHYFQFKRSEFLEHYHKRSNVETTISMIKMRFGGSVRAKVFAAQVNEVLLKVLVHNLCCLVHAFYELDIAAEFWQETGRMGAIIPTTPPWMLRMFGPHRRRLLLGADVAEVTSSTEVEQSMPAVPSFESSRRFKAKTATDSIQGTQEGL